MRQPCIVGVSDAKIDERGCVSKDSSVLSIQKDCAIEALEEAGLNIADIDDGVIFRPRAAETESRFSDKYQRIVNRAANKPFQAFSSEVGLSDLASNDPLAQYQILWIDDSNYFRIISRETLVA